MLHGSTVSYTPITMQRKLCWDCILVVYMRIQQDLLYTLHGKAAKSS